MYILHSPDISMHIFSTHSLAVKALASFCKESPKSKFYISEDSKQHFVFDKHGMIAWNMHYLMGLNINLKTTAIKFTLHHWPFLKTQIERTLSQPKQDFYPLVSDYSIISLSQYERDNLSEWFNVNQKEMDNIYQKAHHL